MHDFPAVLGTVVNAVLEYKDVMRLDVCGILITGEQRVLDNL